MLRETHGQKNRRMHTLPHAYMQLNICFCFVLTFLFSWKLFHNSHYETVYSYMLLLIFSLLSNRVTHLAVSKLGLNYDHSYLSNVAKLRSNMSQSGLRCFTVLPGSLSASNVCVQVAVSLTLAIYCFWSIQSIQYSKNWVWNPLVADVMKLNTHFLSWKPSCYILSCVNAGKELRIESARCFMRKSDLV